MLPDMDKVIRVVLEHQRDVLTTARAEEAGIPRDRLCQAVSTGHLRRVARGAYVDAEVYAAATPEAKHTLAARAIQATLSEKFPLSHHTAAVAWGMPVLGSVPRQVHVTRLDGGYPRRNRAFTTHRPEGLLTAEEHDGLWLLSPARAWAGMRDLGMETVVAAGDAALRCGLLTREDAEAAARGVQGRAGTRLLEAALNLLDPTSESAGESRCRVILIQLGYQIRTQVEIRGTRTPYLARVDFALREDRVVIEFDGMKKYGNLPEAASDAQARLVAEKAREDFLRSLGFEVVRLTWADLADPGHVRSLVEAAIAQARHVAAR